MAHSFVYHNVGRLAQNRRYKFTLHGDNPEDLLKLEELIAVHLGFFGTGLNKNFMPTATVADPKVYFDTFMSVYNSIKPISLDAVARIIHNFMSKHVSMTDAVASLQYYDGYDWRTAVHAVVTANARAYKINGAPPEGLAVLGTGCSVRRYMSSVHTAISFIRQYATVYPPLAIDVWDHPEQYGGWKSLLGYTGNVTKHGYWPIDLDADFAFEAKYIKSLQEATTAPSIPSMVDTNTYSPTLMEELRAAARQLEHHEYSRAVHNAYLDNAPTPWAVSRWQRLPTPNATLRNTRPETLPYVIPPEPVPTDELNIPLEPGTVVPAPTTVNLIEVPFDSFVSSVEGVCSVVHVREPYHSRTIEYGLNAHGQRIARRVITDDIREEYARNRVGWNEP